MLLIYVQRITPRCLYVFDFIFEQRFQLKYRCTTSLKEFEQEQGVKIWYADAHHDSAFCIKSCGFLEDDSLKIYSPDTFILHGMPVIFARQQCYLKFDVFSAVFYMLSRYEEYLPFTTDSFGRFPATESIAFKNNFLHLPVIDVWLQHLANEMQKFFPAFKVPSACFQNIFTYDIDIAYKYRGRGILRFGGALLKDMLQVNRKAVKERLQTMLALKKDPWDVYDQILESTKDHKTVFFFPTGNRSKYDRHLDFQHPIMARLLKKISRQTNIGLHPSFASFKNLMKIKVEKERLEFITGQKITKSRQHYLRLSFPQTYLHLLAAGIEEDYSLAYPETPGFRAGTAHPFFFYDLKDEKATALKIYPAIIMDATFEYYQQPQNMEELYLQHLHCVKEYGGNFISIWHNDLLQKKKYRQIHDMLIHRINTG